MRKTFIIILATLSLISISNTIYGSALGFKREQHIPATIIEPIYEGDIFIGFSFKKDRIHIKKDVIPIFQAIDADLQNEKKSDTITLIHFYTDFFNDFRETQFIKGNTCTSYYFDYKGDATSWNEMYDIDSIAEHKAVHSLRHHRSKENLVKTIASWDLDSIADMLLYSGSSRNLDGILYCDRIIISSEAITNWERLTINNVFFWSSPSLIEQMPLEFKQDSMVKVIYKRDISNRILELEKEKAPIEDIRSRKFWRYDQKK